MGKFKFDYFILEVSTCEKFVSENLDTCSLHEYRTGILLLNL